MSVVGEWVCVGHKGQPHLVHVGNFGPRGLLALCGAKYERPKIECSVTSRCRSCEDCNRRLSR